MSSAPASWGPWRLNVEDRVLYTDENSAVNYEYEVDLKTCRTSGGVLDWIFHVHGKAWAPTPEGNAEILAGLVAAFDDILDPQRNLCSGGGSKVMTNQQLDEQLAKSQS